MGKDVSRREFVNLYTKTLKSRGATSLQYLCHSRREKKSKNFPLQVARRSTMPLLIKLVLLQHRTFCYSNASKTLKL